MAVTSRDRVVLDQGKPTLADVATLDLQAVGLHHLSDSSKDHDACSYSSLR